MLLTHLGVCERNLAHEDARSTLDAILAGRVTPIVLPLIPLMRGGGESGIITDWAARASAEPDYRRRCDYASLALVFAEKAGCWGDWAKALEGWNVIESKQVQEWQAQALVTGELIGQIRPCQDFLSRPVTSREELRQKSRDELTRMAEELKRQIPSRTNGPA